MVAAHYHQEGVADTFANIGITLGCDFVFFRDSPRKDCDFGFFRDPPRKHFDICLPIV